jgi:hypothetical protein
LTKSREVVFISCSLDRRGLAVLNFAKLIRWRLLLGLALIACTGVVLWTVYRQSWERNGPSWEGNGPFWDKYQKVRPGTTETEAKEILGTPMLEEYPGGSLGPYCLAWFEGDQTIAVDFDLDGTATAKRFRPGRNSGWVHERTK